MAIPEFLDDLNIITKLGDYPRSDNGLSTMQFKAKFDEAGLKLQNYINNTMLPYLNQLIDVQALLNGILDSTLTLVDKAANAKATGDALAKKLNRSGDSMAGYLSVPAPKQSSHVTNKEYVDSKKKSASVRLLADGWTDNTQTVSIDGMLAAEKCDVIVSPVAASYLIYHENLVQASGQATGSLTFICNKVPTMNLDVNVLILY